MNRISIDLSLSEIEALWLWHHESEFKEAGNQHYDDAKWHHERAAEIRRVIDNSKSSK